MGRIVAIKVLVESLGDAVVPAFRELRLDLRIVFLGIVNFVSDDGLLEPLASPINDLELLPAESKQLRLGRDLRGQFLLLDSAFSFLAWALALKMA